MGDAYIRIYNILFYFSRLDSIAEKLLWPTINRDEG